MDHAKKLIVIPQEAFQRLKNDDSSLNKLDKAMSLILTDKKLSDSEKWSKYSSVLQQFLYIAKENRQPVSLTINEAEPKEENKKIDIPDTLKETLLSTIPIHLKRKADKLYSLLKTSDALNWNNDGTIRIKGNLIQGANIVDLVNDILRSRKNINPVGWQDFSLALKELHVPQEFIGNTNRWNYIRNSQSRSQRGTGITKRKLVKSLKWEKFNFKK